MCSTSGRTRGAGGCRGGEAGAEAPWMALSAATAGPRCAPIIMDYVRRRPRAGNSAVRSRRTGAAARPQGPNGRNTVNSYYHISIMYKVRPTSYTQHGETMENGSVVRFVPTVNGSDRRVSGGPEGAQSPKWAKPPHIQEHSRGGRRGEVRKVLLWAPTRPGPSPTDARTCSRIAHNGLRYDVGCGS